MILSICKVLNTFRIANSPTCDPEPGKNGWLTKGSRKEAHKSGLWTPLYKGVSLKSFIEMKGQTRLKLIQKIRTRARTSNWQGESVKYISGSEGEGGKEGD